MMRRIKNGEPVFHTHECSEERKGKVMTAEELHDFAVQVLISEYSDTNADVVKYDKKAPNEADFYFVNSGKKPNFTIGATGEKKVNVMVVYRDEFNTDISGIDTSWMVEEYRRTGAIPRITLASAWCISDQSEDGKPAICGGEFCFKYYSISLLPDEENEPLERKLSEVQLAVKFAEAWRYYDADKVAPYLDKDFHYGSEWVFDEMPSRAEYLDYFRAKLATLSPKSENIKVGIGRNHQTGDVAVLILQGKTLSALALTVKDGRITSGMMKEHSSRYKLFDPDDELYMNHGDHLDSIMSAKTLMSRYLKTIVQDAKSWKQARTFVTTADMYEEKTDVFSLMYGEGNMRMLVIAAASTKNNTNEFMALYPVTTGVPTEVKIDKIIEWDNQIEATVFCSVGEFEFAFFPVDYYCNKKKYKVGETMTVDLSAIGMSVEEAQRGFQFEGQQAVDWLAKIGEKPDYDENGNVMPVKFSMEKLVAFINKDSKCPDEAEFQSPVAELEKTSVLGVDFYKSDITICRRDTDDGELEVSIPLYFRQDFFPTVQKEDPIRGWLWVTGSVTGEHEEGNSEPAEVNKLAKIAADFEEYMEKFDYRAYDDTMAILSKLPALKIHKNYILDVFEEGDDHGSIMRAYCYKDGAFEYYNPTKENDEEETVKANSILGLFGKKVTQKVTKQVHIPYDDSLLIKSVDWGEADDVPPVLSYFDVPFTEEGIIQAWLLDLLTDFLPMGWHANYRQKTFVFNTERIEDMFPEYDPETCGSFGRRSKVRDEVFALDLESLLPSVKISGDKAILEYAYWNDWRGMVKSTVTVEKDGNSVKFSKPETKTLVEYDCGIKF